MLTKYRSRKLAALIISSICITASPGEINSQELSPHVIGITVGTAAGGGYDLTARLLARHMGRHVPGSPTLIVKNMPGAGGLRAAAFISLVAPKDGSELFVMQNSVPLEELMSPGKLKFNASDFSWIGSVSSPASVLAMWHTANISSIDDAKRIESRIGATTSGSTTEVFPLLSNRLLGTKFAVVSGYKIPEIDLAMERMEVDGKGASSWSNYLRQNPDWVTNKKIIPLFQVSFNRDPRIGSVPTLLELTTPGKDRAIAEILTASEAIGRALAGPPGMKAPAISMLRLAFDNAMKDEALLAEGEKVSADVSPISGAELADLVKLLMGKPRDVVDMYKSALQK